MGGGVGGAGQSGPGDTRGLPHASQVEADPLEWWPWFLGALGRLLGCPPQPGAGGAWVRKEKPSLLPHGLTVPTVSGSMLEVWTGKGTDLFRPAGTPQCIEGVGRVTGEDCSWSQRSTAPELQMQPQPSSAQGLSPTAGAGPKGLTLKLCLSTSTVPPATGDAFGW